jgi:hypothetical protein
VEKYIKFFDLVDWDVDITHIKDQTNKNNAQCLSCCESRHAVISLCSQYINIYNNIDEKLMRSALHEVIELMIAPMARVLDYTEVDELVQELWQQQSHAFIQRMLNKVKPLIDKEVGIHCVQAKTKQKEVIKNALGQFEKANTANCAHLCLPVPADTADILRHNGSNDSPCRSNGQTIHIASGRAGGR